MSVFDQRGQNVAYQYNAAGNINFDAVNNRADLVVELEKLKTEVLKARDANVIDAEIVTDVEYQIQKAITQSQKAEPNKNAILEHLSKAKDFMQGVVATGGIVTGIMKAIEFVQQFF